MNIAAKHHRSESVYRLQQVTKVYQDRCVLQVAELDIRAGEIFAIVGPNGAGKSTLLRLLNFLEHPDSGSIHFRGVAFETGKEMPLEMRRRVTMVFQRPLLLNLSVWDNVTYGLRLRGQRDAMTETRTALKAVGLLGFDHMRARTLSGGEAQRVALARAIVLRPEVLLLDEPTANLDPYNVRLTEDVLCRLNKETALTVVMVTHNVFQAKRLAHRVAFLLDGNLVEVADVQRFFDSPVDPRTAAFARGEMVC